MGPCVTTTASGVSDSNDGETFGKSWLPRAGFGLCETVCANSLYRGGPKTLLTDQHLLRTNLFFVTETSELRLAGLYMETIDAHADRRY